MLILVKLGGRCVGLVLNGGGTGVALTGSGRFGVGLGDGLLAARRAMSNIRRGDTLVVWKFDRRSLPHLIETIKQLGDRGAGFASLSESIDATTAGGMLIFHIMGALAEFERSLIVERVNAGIAAAKKRGKHVGRPRRLTPEQIAHARDAIEEGKQTCGSMAEILGIDHSTLTRAMRVSNDATAGTAKKALRSKHRGTSGKSKWPPLKPL